MTNAAISLKPWFLKRILDGSKTVELRRRRLYLSPNTRLWLYSTLPMGSFVAVALIGNVHHDTPQGVWRRYSRETGLSRAEYDSYACGALWVTAIELEKVTQLIRAVPLSEIRIHSKRFQPPQCVAALHESDPVLAVLRKSFPTTLS